MASFTNETKNTTTFVNQSKGFPNLTIDEASGTIDGAEGTIDVPISSLTKSIKNTTSFTNQSKN